MRIFAVASIVLLMEFLCYIPVCAQDFCMGARARSLGSAGVADTSAWTIWNNPAGLSHLHGFRILFSEERLTGISGLNNFAAGLIIPFRKEYVAGISLNRQGYEYFNDQQIGFHASHAIGIYSISASLFIWQRSAGESFRETYPILQIGGTMSLSSVLQLGLVLYNISNTQNDAQTIPLRLKTGMLYRISKQVLLYSDLIHNSNEQLQLNTGMEYRIHTHFYIRVGIMTKPLRMSSGLGFKSKRCAIDYSLSWQHPLGYRHQISLLVMLQKKP